MTSRNGASALVTDGEGRAIVACARSLARAGYRVAVAASARPAAAHWSRACAERLVVPDPLRDEPGFVAALERAAANGRYSLLLPGSDASLSAISAARARLETHVALGLPPHETVLKSLDKLWLVEIAARAGLAAPHTVVCAGGDDAAAAAARLGFPLLLKPRLQVASVSGTLKRLGTTLVEDAESLARVAPSYGEPCLLQAPIAGTVFSYAGVMAGGELLASAFSRYERMWYPDAGNASSSVTVDPPPELTERVAKLVSVLGWSGMFELELLRRADGQFVAIDMNPRPYGSLALAIAAGADLPAVWCDSLRGLPARRAIARAGVRYRWEDAELKHLMWQLARGDVRRAGSVLRPHAGTVHAHFEPRDPGPLAARAIFLSRVVASRPRLSDSVVAELRVPNPTPRPGGRRLPWRTARVAVVGAGPYGLSVGAHLRAGGVDTRVFGEPMGFWRRHMPRGMMLRSRKRSSHIADPRRELTIDDFVRAERHPVMTPSLTLSEFLDYASWYRDRAVPEVDPRHVTRLARSGGAFELTLDDGDEATATHVVVACGLEPFPRRPQPLASLPATLASHTVDHDDLGAFAGRRVLVVGAGQSALESAALLHEAGADTEVISRAEAIYWLGEAPRRGPRLPVPPTDVGGRVTGWLAAAPDAFRCLPARAKPEVSYRCIRPAGAGWLRPRLAAVPITTGRRVVAAEPANGAGVELRLDDGTTRTGDHVLLATGFEVDVRRYAFMSDAVVRDLEVDGGYPRLRAGLESSVPGLHFVGAPAAHTFGPIMRFVVGTWYAAPTVAGAVQRRRQRPLRLSF